METSASFEARSAPSPYPTSPRLRDDVLPGTTRAAVAEWCRDRGRAVVERPIGTAELGTGTLVYGALLGLVPAFAVGRAPGDLPGWFDALANERRLTRSRNPRAIGGPRATKRERP